MPVQITEPVRLVAQPFDGRLEGSEGRYEKRLEDLAGVYRDDEAYARAVRDWGSRPVYWVESSSTQTGPGALITGISVMEPGRIGDEFFMTRGHLHEQPEFAELYYCLAGRGVMIMDSVAGETRAVEMTPGTAVYVPGHWIHRSVNVGTDRFVTLFSYGEEAGQDYDIIGQGGGMRSLVVSATAGWALVDNPRHSGYSAG